MIKKTKNFDTFTFLILINAELKKKNNQPTKPVCIQLGEKKEKRYQSLSNSKFSLEEIL